MRQVGTDYHRPAFIEFAELDLLLTLWGFQKDELRTTARSVPSHLLQAEDIPIK